jgi:hypothetical protein
MILFTAAALAGRSQKVDSIYFNLYTDSLKKGFYNYINIDGKLSDGTWAPLDSNDVRLVSNAGMFRGNDLFIDSSFTDEFVKVKAVLRSNPKVHKEIMIYIRKRGFDEPLQTNDEIISDMQRRKKKS